MNSVHMNISNDWRFIIIYMNYNNDTILTNVFKFNKFFKQMLSLEIKSTKNSCPAYEIVSAASEKQTKIFQVNQRH